MSPYVSAEYGLYLPTISLLFPVILFTNICFVIYWLIAKPRFAMASIIALLLGWKVIPRHYNIGGNSTGMECGTEIQILSQNLQAAKYFKRNKRELDESKVLEFTKWVETIKNIDILCFQEQRYHANELLSKHLIGYNKHAVDTIGTSIFSSFPMKEKGFLNIGGNTKYAAWADLDLEGQTVRVYSVHLSSNMISDKAKDVAQDHNLRDTKTWDRIKKMIRSYGRNSIARKKQLALLYEHMASGPEYIVFAGDFNDVPQSYIYQKQIKKFKDSFKEKGSGIGSTFSGLIPGLRIDYVWASKNMDIIDHQVLKQSFSDHFPISASICVGE